MHLLKDSKLIYKFSKKKKFKQRIYELISIVNLYPNNNMNVSYKRVDEY